MLFLVLNTLFSYPTTLLVDWLAFLRVWFEPLAFSRYPGIHLRKDAISSVSGTLAVTCWIEQMMVFSTAFMCWDDYNLGEIKLTSQKAPWSIILFPEHRRQETNLFSQQRLAHALWRREEMLLWSLAEQNWKVIWWKVASSLISRKNQREHCGRSQI